MQKSMRSKSRSFSSSARHSSSSAKLLSDTGTHFLGLNFERWSIFSLLSSMTNEYPGFIVQSHVAIEIAQILAFGLLPYHAHRSFSLEGIGKALFFTHLPLFDAYHLQAEMLGTVIAASIMFLLLGVITFFVAAYLYLGDEDAVDTTMGSGTYRKLGHLVSLVGTVGFVPMCQNFISLAYCVPDSDDSLWFSEIDCGSGVGIYGLILATFGVTMTCIIAYFMNVLIFDSNGMSRHMLARANSSLDAWYLAFRIISIALFHHFHASNQLKYFAVWMSIWTFVMGFAYCYYVPYYRKIGQKLRVSALFLCCFFSVFTAIGYAPDVADAFQSNHIDTIIVLVLAIPLSWCFTKFALLRTSSVFLHGMEQLNEGIVNFDSNYFCRGLPENDSVFDEDELVELFSREEDEEDDDVDDDDYNFTLPYIDEVSCPEDVELATRFLIFSRKCTNKLPTRHQLKYACKLFSKGIALYRESTSLRLAFALFLGTHGGSPKAAQSQLTVLKTMEAPLWVRYRAYVEQQKLNAVLNAKSSSRMASYAKAKKKHHDALQSTVEFWQLLLNDDADKEALSSTTRNILSAKKEVLSAYVRLLERHPTSMELVAGYSIFCETVLDDIEATNACNQYLSELREMKKASGMRGAKGRAAKDKETVAQLPLELDTEEDGEQARNSTFLQRSKYILYTIMFLITGVAVAATVAYYYTNSQSDDQLSAVYNSGTMRSLAAQASVAVADYVELSKINTSTVAINDAGKKLLGIQQDFKALHNSLSYTSLQAADEGHRNFNRDVNKLQFDGERVGYWTLGTMVSVALRDIYNEPLSSKYVDWALDELPSDVTAGLNQSTHLYHKSFADEQRTKSIVSITLSAAACVGLALLVMIAMYNSQMIAASRADIFSLFTLVPRDVIKRMVKANKKKVTQVSEFFVMKTKQKIYNRIGAGEDEREELDLGGGGGGASDTGSVCSDRKGSVSSSMSNSMVSTNSASQLSSSQLGALSGRNREKEKKQLERNIYGEGSGAALRRTVFLSALIVAVTILASTNYGIPQQRDALAHVNEDLVVKIERADVIVVERLRELYLLVGHRRFDHLTAYQNLRQQHIMFNLEKVMLTAKADAEELKKLFELTKMHNALRQIEDVTLKLSLPSFKDAHLVGHSALNTSFIESTEMSWAEGGIDLLFHEYDNLHVDLDTKEFSFLPSSADAAQLNATEQFALAKRVLFSRSVDAMQSDVHKRLIELDAAWVGDRYDYLRSNFIVTLSISIAMSVVILVFSFVHIKTLLGQNLDNKKMDLVMNCLLMLVIIALIPVQSVTLHRVASRSRSTGSKLHDATILETAWFERINKMTMYTNSYSFNSGDLYWLLQYRDEFFKNRYSRSLHSVATGEQEDVVDFPTMIVNDMKEWNDFSSQQLKNHLISRANEAANLLQEAKRIIEIPLVLTYYVYTPTQTMINATFINSIDWNITAEPNYHLTIARFGKKDTFYTNRVEDLSKNNAEKIATAQGVLGSVRVADLITRASSIVDELIVTMEHDIIDSETTRTEKDQKLVLTSLILSIITLVCVVISGLDVFMRYASNSSVGLTTANNKNGKNAPASSSSGAESDAGLMAFFSAKYGPYVITTILVTLLLVFLVLVVVEVEGSRPAPKRIDRSTERTQLVAESMLVAKKMKTDSEFVSGIYTLQDIQRRMELLVPKLYFDSQADYFSVGVDSTQDSLLFDTVSKTATNYYSDCNATYGTQLQEQLSLGVGIFFEELWTLKVKNVIQSTPATFPSALTDMESHYAAMILGLSQSSQRYLDYELDRSNTWASVIIAIGSVASALAILAIVFVIRPFIEYLAREESSASLMLKIIPEDAVERNSQIAAYLESGSANAGDGDNISDAIASMSTVPVIAIDVRGIILRFTPAAEAVFGYSASEVLGSNVKKLMPKEIADNHDTYLANYRRTKKKHIIDNTRRVLGIRKDLVQIPLDVSVTELNLGEEDSVYIAFLRDVSSEIELNMQDKLNRYITEMSQDSIISIDHMGTILSVNSACTQVFGYAKDEMLRENIKMLMPSEIALNHDGYLQKYRETGIKRVVDNTRHVQAQKKSGEVFQVSVTVREIKGEIGESSTFIGFVVDVTAEHNAMAQNAVNEIVSDLSPVPIIAINHLGVFVKFSRAAAELFNQNKDDLVGRGRNVQILVPKKYGNHDQYLQRYMKTGVKTVIDKVRKISCVKRDGTEFPAELTVREIPNKKGMPPVFLAYLVDVTQTLKVSEGAELTSAIMRYSMIPVISIDYKGKIGIFNDAAEEAFGWKRDEVEGENVKLLCPNAIAKQHDSFLETYLRTREKHVVDATRSIVAKRRDGSTFPAEITLKEVEESSSGPGSFFAYIRDVTHHRQTLQQFMINDAITSLSTVPIVGINNKGIIEAFSPAAESCFGYTVSEVLGENVKLLTPPEVAARHDDYLANYHKTGIKKIVDNVRVVTAIRKNGSTFTMEISVREIKKEGQMSSFVAYLRDTSQDMALEDERAFGTTIRDLSPIPIIQTDKFGIITYVNNALLAEWGYTDRNDLVNKNVQAIMPESFRDAHDDHVARFRSDPSHSTVVGKIRRLLGLRKDGSIFEIEAKIQSVLSKRSDMFILVGFLRNLATQLKLEQANYTIDTLTNLSTIPIIAIDHRGVVIKFSQAAENAWGYSHTEVEGNNVKMLMPDNIAEKHDSYLKQYFKSGVRTVIDNVLRQDAKHKSGNKFPVELAIKEVKKAGQESLFIGYVRDATEDTALETATNQAHTVTDSSPIPIVMTNRRGTVTTFNESASALFDYLKEEVVGNNVSMLMGPDDAKYHDRYLKLYAKNKIKNAIDNVKNRTAARKDGSLFPVEIIVKEILPSSGDVTQTKYLSFIKDLTSIRLLHQAGMVNDAIASITSVPLIAITARGVVMRFSESAEQVFGYTAQEVIGKNVNMLMPQATAKEHDMFLKRYVDRKTTVETTFERRVTPQRRNGETFPAKLSVREVRKTGQESMFVGYLEDMTSQYELDIQKKIVDTAVQVTTVPIIMIEPSGIIAEFNAAAEGCFGYLRRDVLGKNVNLLMPKKVAESHDAYLMNYLNTGVKTIIDNVRNVQGKRRDGRKFPMEISVREVKDDNKHYFVGYIRDTTQQFALREASEMNQSIISVSPSPLIIIDDIGTIKTFSPAAERTFGYVQTEVVGENVKMLMPERWASNHDGYLARFKETKEPHVLGKKTSNLFGLTKQGNEFPLELFIGEVKNSSPGGGSGSTFVAIARDITEDVETELESKMGLASEGMTTKAIIAIDEVGKILKANSAASDIFEYSSQEMVGNNIRMLMPQELAEQHDSYLQRYKDTRVKRVVDIDRTVPAKLKSGAQKMVKLSVREIISATGSIYVGHVADEALAKRRAYSPTLGATLMELIDIPIISIDTQGIVLNFNRGAEKVFEFSAAQMIGKNVSLLMPQEVQRNHDSYLENYLKTGEKKVIDSRNTVVAETKSGKQLSVEISIREVKSSTAHFYVGYLRPKK